VISPIADRISTILRDRCLVQVSGLSKGSGFFAAPGFVITCAHVAGSEKGRRVTITGPQGEAEATVQWASQPPAVAGSIWPYPDLAIVELEGGPHSHECAYVEQAYPILGTQMHVYGHSGVYVKDHLDVKPALTTYGGLHGLYGDKVLQLDAGELPAGMSGGPVLDLSTGVVRAIAKTQRTPKAAMGGLAIPLKAIRGMDPALYRRLWRAHDLYHAEDSLWLRSIDAMHTIGVSGLEHSAGRALRRLLASLPERDEHRAAWTVVAGPQTGTPDTPLLDYRDVVDELGELFLESDDALPRAVAYAADLARDGDEPHAAGLRQWVLQVSGQRRHAGEATARLAEAPTAPHVVSLMAELTPASTDHSLVRLNVWRHLSNGESVPVHLGSTPTTPHRAWLDLQSLLPKELDEVGGSKRRVMVEVFAALGLMNENLADWRLWPSAGWSALGRRYAVVLRDVERRYDRRVLGVWQTRWDSLATEPVGTALTPVDCADRAHEEHEGLIEADPMLGALALAASPFKSPTRSALEVALPAGVPVLLWPRRQCQSCPSAGGTGCPGADFLQGLAEELRGTPLDELPERVRELRSAAAKPDAADHCGRDLVVVWDNPYRQPPPMRRALDDDAPLEEVDPVHDRMAALPGQWRPA
jgi:hypothetical protein